MAGDVNTNRKPAGQARPPALPLSDAWRTQLLDAVILASVAVAQATVPVGSAARMALLAECRMCGLAGTPPSLDIRARFDHWLSSTGDPRRRRQLLARHMDPFVGTPWVPTILRIAETVARGSASPEPALLAAPTVAALRALGISLGVCWSNDCGPTP